MVSPQDLTRTATTLRRDVEGLERRVLGEVEAVEHRLTKRVDAGDKVFIKVTKQGGGPLGLMTSPLGFMTPPLGLMTHL